MLAKEQLIFDPTGANTDECDTVGSYVLGSTGNAVTSTDLGGGVEALDVNIAGGNITVDLDHTTGDSVQIGDGTEILAVNADGSINTNVSGTVGLDAASLAALENITIDAGTVELGATSLAALENITIDGGTIALDAATLAALEDITVSATDLDIRDLTAATDSVTSIIEDANGDALDINADGSINVNLAGGGKLDVVATNNQCAHSAVAITDAAAPLVGTALTGRTRIHIQNRGARGIYIGCDNTVTTTDGTFIPKGASASFDFSDAVNLHAITEAGGNADVRIIEFACV